METMKPGMNNKYNNGVAKLPYYNQPLSCRFSSKFLTQELCKNPKSWIDLSPVLHKVGFITTGTGKDSFHTVNKCSNPRVCFSARP